MTAPNIVNVATITGRTSAVDLSTTAATSVISNASGSGKVLKVNNLTVCNDDGTNAADITISYYSAAALGGTAIEIVKSLPVPAKTSIVVIDKNDGLYLEEDKSIGATASAANRLNVIYSYEEIS